MNSNTDTDSSDDFPQTSITRLNALRECASAEFAERFGDFVQQYETALVTYLIRCGVPPGDSKEVVQDFLVKQCQHRKVFSGPAGNGSFRRFIRACVLRHFIDFRRARVAYADRLARLSQTHALNETTRATEDSLELSWAVATLQLAIADFRAAKLPPERINETAGNGKPYSQMSVAELDWEIFVLKYLAPIDPQPTHTQKRRSQDIAQVLQVVDDRKVRNRLTQIHQEFQRCLDQAIRTTSGQGNFEESRQELKFAFMLSGVHVFGATDFMPEFWEEPVLGSEAEFSIDSIGTFNAPNYLDLVWGADEKDKRLGAAGVWQHLMSLRLNQLDRVAFPDNVDGSARLLEPFLKSSEIGLSDLHLLRKVARQRAACDSKAMQEVYHLLYVVAIAKAKNLFDQTTSSMKRDSLIQSMQFAMKYDWIPGWASREIELSLRLWVQQDSSSPVG